MFERVRKILAKNLGINEEDITLETRLYEGLGVDSMDLFNIIDIMEEEFGVRIPESNDINKVQDIIELLSSLV